MQLTYSYCGNTSSNSGLNYTSVWSNKALRAERKSGARLTDESDHPAMVINLSTLEVILLTIQNLLRLEFYSLSHSILVFIYYTVKAL